MLASEVVLDVAGLSVEFPTARGVVRAVSEVSFQIGRGDDGYEMFEWLGLLARTAVARAISAGLNSPSSESGTQCDEPVVWVFARDLLASGIAGSIGEGDITIEPADRDVRITLATDCLATMLAPRNRHRQRVSFEARALPEHLRMTWRCGTWF